jgi:hypothetical protein
MLPLGFLTDRVNLSDLAMTLKKWVTEERAPRYTTGTEQGRSAVDRNPRPAQAEGIGCNGFRPRHDTCTLLCRGSGAHCLCIAPDTRGQGPCVHLSIGKINALFITRQRTIQGERRNLRPAITPKSCLFPHSLSKHSPSPVPLTQLSRASGQSACLAAPWVAAIGMR